MTLDRTRASRAFSAARRLTTHPAFDEAARRIRRRREQYRKRLRGRGAGSSADGARQARQAGRSAEGVKEIGRGTAESSSGKQAALELGRSRRNRASRTKPPSRCAQRSSRWERAEKRESAQKISEAYASAGAQGEAAASLPRAGNRDDAEDRAARLADYERALQSMPGPGWRGCRGSIARSGLAAGRADAGAHPLHAGDPPTPTSWHVRSSRGEHRPSPKARRASSSPSSSSANVKPTLIGVALP